MARTNPERWQQIEALFHAASETQGEEREALLSRSDPQVRYAVEAMLLHTFSEEELLDRPAWEVAGDGPQPRAAKLAPGEQLGPYRVEGWIGRGGMGDVYRATDVRLNRTVALKVTAGEFSARFEREARNIAALNHPNICQLYDIGPNMLIMEYVVGKPVVSAGEGPLGRAQALQLAMQMASAIEAAHARGIVHRDLKPANILVTPEGVVKLLDFGISKRTPVTGITSETASATVAGLFMGTPAYMSPEVAEGEVADARSDLFSFGAILYEILAGKRAFPGESVASTLGAVMNRDPDPLNASPELAAIVSRCLAKSPADRFQSAGELRKALEEAATHREKKEFPWRRPAVAAAAVVLIVAAVLGVRRIGGHGSDSIDAIAVLPLQIQSSDPEAGYISDGIADSIRNRLTRLPGLKVIPNTLAQQYKNDAANFPKLVKELGIDAVLAGRVVQHGADLTINIELNDVRHGRQLWGEQYTRKTTELLMVQNDISKAVLQRLRSQLSARDQQRVESGSTVNPEAYQLYLQGSYYTQKFTRTGFSKGSDYLNQAIALDPGYADAYSALAHNYINQDDWFLPPVDSAPKARAAAQKALSLQEGDVTAHVVLAIETDWYEWDWTGADREFRRALELDPLDGDALRYYSWFLPSMGRSDEAVNVARLQTKTYPLSFGANGNLGSVYVFTQRWDEAITQLRHAIDLNPNYWFGYYFLGRAYEQKGEMSLAIEAFQKGLKLESNTELWAGLGHAFAVSGNREEALKVLDHLNEISQQRYVAPYNYALLYLGLGDVDAAFSWLEKAHEARSYMLAVYLNTDARLKSLYSDPRYENLRLSMKLPPPI